jgi:RpiB/LacA/LacB family sugar-phosphate isomerase
MPYSPVIFYRGADIIEVALRAPSHPERVREKDAIDAKAAANKVKGIRAALAWNLSTAKLARQHNDANVVAVGGRQHSVDEATSLIEAFLQEPFNADERHSRRIEKISRYESTGVVPD